ncbi:MAG: sulfite exporter TauE/SafE family protein [Chloroflexi bacterium]|nr:sulfite exporter TauE/SafE family protein [Chloroflexota bacterium]
MIGSISLLQLVVAVVAAFVGSTVFSPVGFGIGVTSIPILLLVFDPQTVVVMVNTVTIPLLVLVIFQTRRYIHLRRTVPIAIAGLLGMPIGVLFLSSADAGVLRISITAVIIALALLLALNPNVARLRRVPDPHITGPAVGFVVSIMLNSLGIGGPLIALFALTQGLAPALSQGHAGPVLPRGGGCGRRGLRRRGALHDGEGGPHGDHCGAGRAGLLAGRPDSPTHRRGPLSSAGDHRNNPDQPPGARPGAVAALVGFEGSCPATIWHIE